MCLPNNTQEGDYPFDDVEERLRALDDACLHIYSNVLVLHDPGDQYARRLGRLAARTPELRKQRLEGKLDMLIRRSTALEPCLAVRDVLAISRICLELITLCLKITALLDDVPFDPRKRLFKTALAGRLGQRIEDRIRGLFASIGTVGDLADDADFAGFSFPDKIQEIVKILSEEASRQGFQVGLESPDRRHIE